MRRVLALVAAVLVALVGAGASQAQRAVHFHNFEVNDSFLNDFLSEQCGFDVTTTISGSADVTLIYNDAGLVVREIDTLPGGTITFSSANGSFSFPAAQTAITAYPGGAMIGSVANLTLVGLIGHVPGFIASEAGIDIFANAVVTGFSPEGIPLVDFTDATILVTSHGHRNSGEDVVAAICAALG